jgi:ABC-type molybdate transport system substrate-binding protein
MTTAKHIKIFSGGAMRPLPAALQNVIIYAAGLSPRAPNAQAATAFLVFMRAEQAKQLMRANGLDPA